MRAYVKLGLLLAAVGVLAVVDAVPVRQGLAQPANSKLVAMPAFGNVADFRMSPDGLYVVYGADQDTDGIFELYSVPLTGGVPIKLNGALVPGGEVSLVHGFQISLDSSRVVYRADQDTDTVVELYSVPITGGAAVKLNAALVPGGEVGSFTISPDSSRVVYGADQDADEVDELYSVPIAGGAPVKLNGAPVAGGDVKFDWQISPDSSRVVYRADQDTDGIFELYSVPIAGPASAGVKLNHELVANGTVYGDDVYTFEISPDSSRVVHATSWLTIWILDPYTSYSDHVVELYSVPIDGPPGDEIQLWGATDGGYPDRTSIAGIFINHDVDSLQISPDSSRVVFRGDIQFSDVEELWSVPIDGPPGALVKLSHALFEDGDVEFNWEISPDGSRVVYRADQGTDGIFELYSVPIAGPASAGVKLNGPIVAGGDVFCDYQISPDSSRVVYRADQDTDGIFELYSVPVDGPASSGVKLNGTLVPDGYVQPDTVKISPDSSHVLYQAFQDTFAVLELYGVPIAGPASAGFKVNGELVPGGWVGIQGFEISPDSSRVVYEAMQDTDNYELYVTVFGAPSDEDGDNDGFDDAVEDYIGTDPLDDCPDDPSDDAWPPDIVIDMVVDIFDAITFLAAFPSAEGSPNYSTRLDMAGNDGVIDIFDALTFLAYFPSACTNP